MLSKAILNTNIYIEFYSLTYISVLIIGILIFSSTSTYKYKNFIYLSDISILTRFKIILYLLFFFFCLVGGLPPFLTFITKFYLLSLISNSILVFFILIFIVSLLIYYLSIFKFLRVSFNYSTSTIKVLSYNTIYFSLYLLILNFIISYSMHIFVVDLI